MTVRRSHQHHLRDWLLRWFVVVVGLGALLTACGPRSAPSDSGTPPSPRPEASAPPEPGASQEVEPPAEPDPLTALVYFSRPGENYWGDDDRRYLEIGNTQVVAEQIADLLDADVIRLEAADPYPESYDETVARNRAEQDADARPEIAGGVPDLSEYDAIVLGSPVWGTRAPMIIRTLLDGNDVTGKTIYPFVTYGVGAGRVFREYAEFYPEANVAEGLAIRGEDAAGAGAEIAGWVAGGPGRPRDLATDAGVPVTETTLLTDVMSAPGLEGFGELLLPSNERVTGEMTVADTGRLLPYHSNINPTEVAATLNQVIDGVREGDVTFHPVYDDEEVARDPAKAEVGLFHFRGDGDADAPFAIISPGGGFSYVGSVHEGFPYAREIAAQGYPAFVLNYRVGSGGQPATEDLAHAIDYVFQRHDELDVGTEGYSLWGSSAGARMAANLGSYGTTAFGAADRTQAATVVIAYTGHSDYTESDPATFAVVGGNDGIASPGVMEERARRLERAGVAVEFQRYEGIGHGFGLGTGTVAEGWVDDAVRFWEEQLDTP